MTAGGRELGARSSPACSFYLAANFPDLTSKARNRSLRPEGVSLFERHPPHFSTGVYTDVAAERLTRFQEGVNEQLGVEEVVVGFASLDASRAAERRDFDECKSALSTSTSTGFKVLRNSGATSASGFWPVFALWFQPVEERRQPAE